MRFLFAWCCLLVVAVSVVTAEPGYGDYIRRARDFGRRRVDFARQAYRGSKDMYRAYSDMRDANWRNSDRYFHARGNRDAASRGSGGRWAATVISNGREWTDRLRGGSSASSASDQQANQWGRNGGDLNKYRPPGLPSRY